MIVTVVISWARARGKDKPTSCHLALQGRRSTQPARQQDSLG